MGTPSGVISILTTNNIDSIDKAILRPGRIDSSVELSYLDQNQFDRLCLHLTGVPPDGDMKVGTLKIAPADITGVVKNFMGDPEGQHKALRNYLKDRVNG